MIAGDGDSTFYFSQKGYFVFGDNTPVEQMNALGNNQISADYSGQAYGQSKGSAGFTLDPRETRPFPVTMTVMVPGITGSSVVVQDCGRSGE